MRAGRMADEYRCLSTDISFEDCVKDTVNRFLAIEKELN
jgi:hypothetical protein